MTSQSARRIVTADTVVTLDGSVHEPGRIVIEQDTIVEVGPNPTKQSVTDGDEHVALGRRLVMPGLVNSHTHTPMVIFRGLAEGHSLLDLDGWYNTIRVPEYHLTADMIAAPVELSCAEMIAAGTTGFADQYFFANEIAPVIKRSGMRATLAYGIVELGDGAARATELDRADAFCRSLGDDPLLRAWIGPHAFFVDNTEAAIVAEVEMAARHSTGIHAHYSADGEEDRWCHEQHGMSAFQRLDQLGALDRPLVLAHNLVVDAGDMGLLADRPVTMVMIASVAMASGMPAPPVRALLDAGVTLAIGTDNMANNGSYDLFEEMRTLSRLAAFDQRRPGVVSSTELLTMATVGGARALDLPDPNGRLAAGAAADLIALDPGRLGRGARGAQSIESAIVWGASAAAVTDVMVGGSFLLRNGEHLTTDRQGARAATDNAFALLSAAMSSGSAPQRPPALGD